MPSRDGSIELLRPFVNLTDSDFLLLIGWMAAALRPAGPYPVLVIHGEQGSAKSTLAKVIRQLIDPQTSPLLAEPRSTRDLMVTAVNGWVLAYDNVSAWRAGFPIACAGWRRAAVSRRRALFSNDERNVIHAQRPIILNGIDEFVHKGDLADRAVFLHLPRIAPGARREEAEFWRSFRELQPKILGGLLDAVVGALRELPSVRLAELPRMADFARFGEALGRGPGMAPARRSWPHILRTDGTPRSRRSMTLFSAPSCSSGSRYWQAGESETNRQPYGSRNITSYRLAGRRLLGNAGRRRRRCWETSCADWPRNCGTWRARHVRQGPQIALDHAYADARIR